MAILAAIAVFPIGIQFILSGLVVNLIKLTGSGVEFVLFLVDRNPSELDLSLLYRVVVSMWNIACLRKHHLLSCFGSNDYDDQFWRLLVFACNRLHPGQSDFEELVQKDQQGNRGVIMVGAHLAHRLVEVYADIQTFQMMGQEHTLLIAITGVTLTGLLGGS
ncbi:hypothetical protein SAY86_019650 [Trapa natans]|uniref:Uncharacterized protein n=1 Tax=Trapa natans TaxID=22666 RepID=A0AAN7M125_TRANT|nr:hypothetical protein SAY86_019650 [Trapa natans]